MLASILLGAVVAIQHVGFATAKVPLLPRQNNSTAAATASVSPDFGQDDPYCVDNCEWRTKTELCEVTVTTTEYCTITQTECGRDCYHKYVKIFLILVYSVLGL